MEFHDTKAAKELFDVNVFGTLRLTQKLLRESSLTFDKQVMKRVLHMTVLKPSTALPHSPHDPRLLTLIGWVCGAALVRSSKGRVINLSSLAASFTVPKSGLYAASKVHTPPLS